MSSIAEQFLSLLNCYVSSWFANTLDGFEMNLYILKPCDFFLLFGLNISNSIHFVGIYWYIKERVSQLRNSWLLVLLLCEHFGAKSLKELSPLECVDVIVRYSREPRREGGGGGWWHSLGQEAPQEHPAVQDLCHHHQKRAGSSVWRIGEWKNSLSILLVYGTQRVIVHSFLRRINGYGHF